MIRYDTVSKALQLHDRPVFYGYTVCENTYLDMTLASALVHVAKTQDGGEVSQDMASFCVTRDWPHV